MQARRLDKSGPVESPTPLIEPGYTYQSITDKISAIVLTKTQPKSWLAGLIISFVLLVVLLYAVGYLFVTGVGIWGINIPVGWGFAIVTFVWWIGIGHAGTLISAILLLFRQEWRTSINRFAEAMTLFAVACAGLFPLLHLGRPWLAYWLFPYPNTFDLWPQFRSPLVWDAFAISTYGTVSLLFWFVGLIPDLASLRDRAGNRFAQAFYGILALGWRGDDRHWHRYETAYLLLAALATPLVVSVHSIVSFDFAASVLPGWHTTVFPPYFVAGAIFSGFAMVLTLLIPLRKVYQLEDFITARHLDNMAKIMLATGLFVAYGYMSEAFTAWYSGSPYERFWLFNRSFGPYGPLFWALMLCNIIIPQALWSGRIRANPLLLFIISIIINIGMWLERYVIIVISLHRDFIPAAWGSYAGTIWDWATLLGTIGLFLTLIFLFIRALPMVSIFEMRHLLTETKRHTAPTDPEPAQPASAVAAEPVAAAETQTPLFGLIAEFDDPDVLLKQVHRAYQAGYRHLAAYSPFPIEGLAEATGTRRTKLPWLVLLGALVGALGGFFLQYYAAVIDYPWNVGGRPFNSWPSFMIVTFELTILFAAGAAVVGMLLRNGLPRLSHPIFNAPRFKLASQDRFFLCIKATDPNFDEARTRQFLADLAPQTVSAVERGPLNIIEQFWARFRGKSAVVIWLALCLGLMTGCALTMRDQPRYESFEQSAFFEDHASARPPVEDTVARGQLHADAHLYTGQLNNEFAPTFPFTVTQATLERGQERYEIFCSPCHGLQGDGHGTVVEYGLKMPPSFHDPELRAEPAGYYFDLITRGTRVMPSYAARIQPEDRWAIIAYIRALQLSQDADLSQVPPDEVPNLDQTDVITR